MGYTNNSSTLKVIFLNDPYWLINIKINKHRQRMYPHMYNICKEYIHMYNHYEKFKKKPGQEIRH